MDATRGLRRKRRLVPGLISVARQGSVRQQNLAARFTTFFPLCKLDGLAALYGGIGGRGIRRLSLY